MRTDRISRNGENRAATEKKQPHPVNARTFHGRTPANAVASPRYLRQHLHFVLLIRLDEFPFTMASNDADLEKEEVC